MRSPFGNSAVVATEIQGHYVQGRDKVVPPLKFAAVAKVLWPHKTAACLAAIAGNKDERTAKRWLSGEYEPPAIIIAAIIVEITKRE